MSQRKQLSPNDLDRLRRNLELDKSWTDAKIHLAWSHGTPDDATVDDFIYFLYHCLARNLDPVMREAYLRLQFNRNTGTKEPIIITSVAAMLKNASLSGKFEGIKSEYHHDDKGNLEAVTTFVWRQGCPQAFSTTIYFNEYAGTTKEGKLTHMWATKGHMMLGKTGYAATLRVAFAAELAGVYVEEEFQKAEPRSSETFVVEEKAEPTKPAPQPDPEVPPTSEPQTPLPATSDVRRTEQPAEPVADSTREALAALKQRLAVDLSIPKAQIKVTFESYFMGFLGVTGSKSLPKMPSGYVDAMSTLEMVAECQRDMISQKLKYEPITVGKYLKTIFDQISVYGSAAKSVFKSHVVFEYDSIEDSVTYARANKVDPAQPDDLDAFLRLAMYDRDIASKAAKMADENGIGISFVLMDMETRLQSPFAGHSKAAVEAAIVPVEEESA